MAPCRMLYFSDRSAERLVEALGVLEEGDQRADRDHPRDHPAAAVPEHQADAQGRDQLHPGEEDGVVEDATARWPRGGRR